MKLFEVLLGQREKTESLFANEDGKTLAEYQRKILINAGKKQFERLQDLGLHIPVSLA